MHSIDNDACNSTPSASAEETDMRKVRWCSPHSDVPQSLFPTRFSEPLYAFWLCATAPSGSDVSHNSHTHTPSNTTGHNEAKNSSSVQERNQYRLINQTGNTFVEMAARAAAAEVSPRIAHLRSAFTSAGERYQMSAGRDSCRRRQIEYVHRNMS